MANKLLSKDGKLIGQDKTLLQAPIGGGASWGEIGGNIENQTDLIDLVNSKAILHEIIYDGTNIKDSEGNILGFADIKLLLDNPNDYVYVNDLTNHCILNYGAYEDDAIWFNSRYKIDGANYLVRLIINWNDQLQYNVDEVPNIDKVLTKPNQAPTSPELVGIGTDNAQKRITIGDNLTLENNVLSAVGGGSSETWELIADITTDEDITTSRSIPFNGNYKKYRMYMIPSQNFATAFNINISTSYDGMPLSSHGVSVSANQKTKAMFNNEIILGIAYPTASYSNYNSGGNIQIQYGYVITNYSYMNSIIFTPSGSGSIPSGTRFYIIGIKA